MMFKISPIIVVLGWIFVAASVAADSTGGGNKTTYKPTSKPSYKPTSKPAYKPTKMPTQKPSEDNISPTTPTTNQTTPEDDSAPPTPPPTPVPTMNPTAPPTQPPTGSPTSTPTPPPTPAPTMSPTAPPTPLPTMSPPVAATFQGTDFWFVETPNIICDGMTVAVANPNQVTANVIIDHAASTTHISLSLSAGTLQNLTFPCRSSFNDLFTTNGPVYHLTSDVGVVVYIFVPLQDIFSNDATLVLPTQALGTRYRVASYYFAGNAYGSYFNVVAVENGTSVQVFDTTNALVGTPVTIDQGQLFQRVVAASDFTAWSIVTDKPVAVFTGSGCTAVGTSSAACDTLMEQVLPESALSSQYVVCPTLSRPINCSDVSCAPDVFRYIATADNTEISLVGSATAIQKVLNRGQFYELQTNDPHTVNASNPLYVFQYLISELSGNPVAGIGDPSLIGITPISLFQPGYTFLTPATFQYDFINIAAPVGTSFFLDGVSLSLNCKSVGFVGGTEFCCGLSPVVDGVHRIVGDKPFGLTVTGFDQYASYGYA